MTIREQILQAVIDSMLDKTPAADRVFRSRVQALARDELPAIVVKPGAEDVTGLGADILMHELEIRIEIYGRGEAADSQLDPVIDSVHGLMMSDTDLDLFVGAIALRGVSDPEFDDADDGSCVMQLIYMAQFCTTNNNLSVAA